MYYDADDYAGFPSAAAAVAKTYTVLLAAGSYELLVDDATGADCIRCCQCQRISYQPMDVAKLYCGFCHRFHTSW